MDDDWRRKPAVTGSFYPEEPEKLKRMVAELIEEAELDSSHQKKALSFVAPHAGYAYSGKTAGFTYKALSKDKDLSEYTFVIIGPNHTGYGRPISLSGRDWSTPMGVVYNDIEMTRSIYEYSDKLAIEEHAHLAEHSVEVQLPFLQHIKEEPRCVFVCMGDQSHDSSELLSKAILHAEGKLKRRIMVIASSDLNHYESAEVSKRKDMPAIDAITRLNTEKFVELLEKSNDTACGYGPITVAALYAKNRGASRGYLLKYSNSGDATKDYSSVVAYASIMFA